MNDEERLKIVIKQMLEHNRILVRDYEKWALFAKAGQLVDTASYLVEAKNLTSNVNAALKQGLRHLSCSKAAFDGGKGL